MAYRHGIYPSEDATPIVPTVRVNSAMPVAFVTAPVHLSEEPYAIINVPRLLFSQQEAVEAFGFSMREEIWKSYTAPQVIFSQFSLYGITPLVLVNVLDPKIHNKAVAGETVTLAGFTGVLAEQHGVLLDTVVVKNSEGQAYVLDTHYTLAFNRDGLVVISALEDVTDGITENEVLTLDFTALAPEQVDIYDIIGGYDVQAGKNTGLELVNEIFPRFRLIPGQLLAPKFSSDPAVAAVMETKAANINGHFSCITLNDIPTMLTPEGGSESVQHRFTDVPAWKNQNNFVFPRQLNLYPMLRLGNQDYHYSSQMAGLIGHTDSENGGVPYNSPSNKNLRVNGLCYEDGIELVLGVEQANFLNGEGIASAINFTNGWTAWGNRTGAFPGNPDPKDNFIPIRRMFMWIANTIVLTYWNRIDFPLTLRAVRTIQDSVNIWLNGLTAQEYILGGRIEFIEDENPETSLMDGIVQFRLSVTPPPPMREINVVLQYDPEYLQTLFSA